MKKLKVIIDYIQLKFKKRYLIKNKILEKRLIYGLNIEIGEVTVYTKIK